MFTAQQKSLNALGRRQLGDLWRAIHHTEPPKSATRAFDLLVPPARGRTGWPSMVSDDHTPYELSLLYGERGAPQIRIMAEPLPFDRSTKLEDTVQVGMELRETLRGELGIDFSSFDAIRDLFLPPAPQGAFALWYAVSFDKTGGAAWKVYFNPAVRGLHEAPRLVEEALERLEIRDAWSTVIEAMPRGPALDELRFFSIDLAPRGEARAKVYGFHHDATPEYLARVLGVVHGAEPGHVMRFCRTLAGGDGVLRAPRQPATCLAFVSGHRAPRTGTVHFPIRAFAGDDATAHKRFIDALAGAGIPSAPYEAAIEALARRPLDEGSGLLAWTALRLGGAAPMVNVYLAPKALSDDATHGGVAPQPADDAIEHVVRRYEKESIATHPFFARLAREPVNLGVLSILVLNVREAVTRHFARRLANVVARVEEEDIRSVLAKQLNDELGDGDPSRTHRLLFERFANGMAQWAPSDCAEIVAPGRALAAVQEELYVQRSPYEGVGATLVMEIVGKQADLAMGEQFRRLVDAPPAEVLEWLALHEELELAHSQESIDLAAAIPRGRKSELAARGAREVADGCWAFLDRMYRLCYGNR